MLVQVILIPLMGPLHLRFPLYNAVSVLDIVRASRAERLATTALPADAFTNPSWQDTEEIALPLAVAPWSGRMRVPLHGVGEPSPDRAAVDDLHRYLLHYSSMQTVLQELEARRRPCDSLLKEALTLERIQNEFLPLLQEYQEFRETVLEEGPATDWLRSRVRVMAKRIVRLPGKRIVVLASADHLPFLSAILEEYLTLLPTPSVRPSRESRERSLLDFAFRNETADPLSLVEQLRQLDAAEARYHEANILLTHDHVHEALAILEESARGDFHHPYFLPGYLLSRLGQLRDLNGDRQGAKRAYRAVLALSYAPPEALEAAREGLVRSFARHSQDTDG